MNIKRGEMYCDNVGKSEYNSQSGNFQQLVKFLLIMLTRQIVCNNITDVITYP